MNNVAPTATFTAQSPVNEGTSFNLSLTSPFDPSSVDTTAGFQYAFDCGDGSGYGAYATSNSQSCPTADNGLRGVKGKVKDKDSGETEYTGSVTANNVAPTATFTAQSPVNEGTPFTLSLTSPLDPSSVDTTAGFEYAFDCGDGSGYGAYATSNTQSCPTTDNGTRSVKGKIKDKDSGETEYTGSVTVENVAPTATFSAQSPVNEGTSFNLSLTGPFDPSSVDTSAGFQYAFDCGDGSGYSAYAASNTQSCPTTDNGTRSVKGKIKDKDNGENEYTGSVTVSNVAPTVTDVSITPAAVVEGATTTFTITGKCSDPGADTWIAILVWGDGSALENLGPVACDASTFTKSASHNYVDDNPTGTASDAYLINLIVTDDDLGNDNSSDYITVHNAAPGIVSMSGTAAPTPIGGGVSVTATFTDGGTSDTHTCTLSWDDSTSSTGAVTETNGSGSCSGTHTYPSAGVYTIGVTVTDDDTSSASAVYQQYVVIFDPNAGFVTGGGWINSPTGAYAPNPTLTGKANFGFVAKYKKGAVVPTGETEFQFKVGDLNFHSTSYDWLVVAGAKAQYKGWGTVNGVANYKFLLTATDGQINGGGGVDKFRIKIWNAATGVAVYDNAPGASEDIDSASPQALAGGSIVIHK